MSMVVGPVAVSSKITESLERKFVGVPDGESFQLTSLALVVQFGSFTPPFLPVQTGVWPVIVRVIAEPELPSAAVWRADNRPTVPLTKSPAPAPALMPAEPVYVAPV